MSFRVSGPRLGHITHVSLSQAGIWRSLRLAPLESFDHSQCGRKLTLGTSTGRISIRDSQKLADLQKLSRLQNEGGVTATFVHT